MNRIGTGLLATVALCGCAGEAVDAPSQSWSTAAAGAWGGPQHQICGGIAGLPCPDGQRCLMRDDYPDATGVCVGPDVDRGWRVDCSLVRCLAVECPEGFRRHYTPASCCGMCIPDGRDPREGACRTPEDCAGLVHILCVGSWSCEGGSCSYSCDVGEPI